MLDHISWRCEKPDEQMATAKYASSPHIHCAALLWESGECLCPLMVNQCDVEALLNSGSARILELESVLEASSLAQGEQVPVICVCRDTCEYPTIVRKLMTTNGSFNVEPGVIKTHQVPVQVGCEFPAIPLLWREVKRISGQYPEKMVKWINPILPIIMDNLAKSCFSPPVLAQAFAVVLLNQF